MSSLIFEWMAKFKRLMQLIKITPVSIDSFKHKC